MNDPGGGMVSDGCLSSVGISGDDLRAVLFDMDGTLTDSERLWSISLERVAVHYGGTLTPATREAMVGQDMWATIDMLHAALGVRADPGRTAAMLTRETEEVFAAGLPWKPGAQDLLHAVRAAGLFTALVTATHRPLVEIALNTLGRNNFDVTVAGDEVTRNKPDPEPYARAMELLALRPEDCLAIEDSPAGSRSAIRAGVPVLVVPSETAVPPADGLVFAHSLVGIDVVGLQRMRVQLLTRTASPAP